MRKKRLLVLLIFILLFFSSSKYLVNSFFYHKPIAKISIKTNGGGVRPDYALFIADYLKEIGVEVSIKIEEWVVFLGTLYETHNYDLGVVAISRGGAIVQPPYLGDPFNFSSSSNIFGIDIDLPYVNQSEQLLTQIDNTTDYEQRKCLSNERQQLVMDKIIPLLPLFASKHYTALWSNTLGYDAEWGIVDSLPYMSYDGLHNGQQDINEFKLSDANWKELNPLFSDDSSSSFISSLLMEPIIQMSPGYEPLKTGLVYEWEQIDDTHFQFWMMDDIYWNPSYNSTARDANSVPLSSISSNEMMVGLKDGLTYSDGTNIKVTAKDAVFTYLTWSNSEISESTSYHEWIRDIYIDPVDELSFHIHIDGDPDTPEIESCPDMWNTLPTLCLPEWFLNSSDPTVTYTEGGVECTGLYADMINTPQWEVFSTSPFGCGKYCLDYSVKNSLTVLQRWGGWYGKGAITGETGLTPFIDTIIIRVIPDSSAELAEFKAGKLDIAGVTIFSAERKQFQADSRFTVHSSISRYSLSFLFFNLRRPFIGGYRNFYWLDEPGKEDYTVGLAIRKAICYAINRDEMNRNLHDGEKAISHSILFPKTSYYYYEDIIKYNFNLEKASDWLDVAGYGLPEIGSYHGMPILIVPLILGIVLGLAITASILNVITKNIRKKNFQ